MVAPNLYGSITADLEEIPKKPRSDKQKAAFEKARAKLAEKRQKAKENNNMSRDNTNDEHHDTESTTDLKVVEITPERKVEQIEPPNAPEKKVDDDQTRPPLWFSTFIKESRENRFLQMKRNREKKKVEREPSPKRVVEPPSPETPTPRAPPPSPETPPEIRESLKTPTPAPRFLPKKNIYLNIVPKRR
jgi:hypothetical protein